MMIDYMKRAIRKMERWYGNSMPSKLDSSEFRNFALTNFELARNVAPNAKFKIDNFSGAAATDGTTIYIPITYFSKDFYKTLGVLDQNDLVPAALAVINGSQVHEAYHIKWSVCKLLDFAAYITDGVATAKKHSGFLTLLNIVEDLYIEARGRDEYPGLGELVDLKNDVLLSLHSLEACIEELKKPDSTVDVLIGLLASRKNMNLVDHEIWDDYRDLVDTLENARITSNTIKDRAYIAMDMYNLIQELVASGKIKEGVSFHSPLPDNKNSEKIDGNISIEMLLMSLLFGIVGLNSEEPEKTDSSGKNKVLLILAKMFGVPHGELVELGKELDEELEAIDMMHKLNAGSLAKEMPKPKISDLKPARVERFEADKLFLQLGRNLRYMRQENHTIGAPMKTGTKIVKQRLARIAIDGKVLSVNHNNKIMKGTPEVIILVDVSGSMTNNSGSRSGEKLIVSASRASMGAYMSLVDAGIPVAVYAHTTKGEDSMVYCVAANRMPLNGRNVSMGNHIEKRFSAMVDVEHNSNIDGVAVDFCANQFTDKPGSKVLMVFSDGSPAGHNYHGQTAIEHTKLMANRARRKGISVLSLSLVQDVLATNDEIYGREFNLRAFGKHLESSLANVLQLMFATVKR